MHQNRRKRVHMLCMVLVATLCFSITGCGTATSSKGICYRVTGGKNEMFLLGTMHVGNKQMYPMGEHILTALDTADTLVLECDTESEKAITEIQNVKCYPTGESLKDHVSTKSYQLAQAAAAAVGYPVGVFDTYKPWAVVSMLSIYTTAKDMGVGNIQEAIAFGVEQKILSLAKEKVKEKVYLETALEQLLVMDAFSPELQEYMLITTCEAISNEPKPNSANTSMQNWPEWWRDGDAKAFADSYLLGLKLDPRTDLMQEYHEKLVTKRNQGMAHELQMLLENEEKHSYFVSIGLLHLVLPDDSVVNELQNMGYTVEVI